MGTGGGEGFPATVYVTEPLGGETVVDLRLGDRVVKALAPPSVELVQDAPVRVSLDPLRLHVFKEDGETVLSAAGANLFSVQRSPIPPESAADGDHSQPTSG